MNFELFISEIGKNPLLLTVVLLTMGVIFVNGWTDAPNSIATCVATRCMSPKSAVLMSAVFNLFGIIVMTLINSTVAMTIKNMVNFGGNSGDATLALCAAMIAIIIWAVAAWAFGIPTSESHALIAGLTGAAIALQNGLSGINGAEWVKVIYGLFLSLGLGFGAGFVLTKITESIFKKSDRRKSQKFFNSAQIFGGAAMSFMHGAQDGQKFMGVLLLGMSLVGGSDASVSAAVPIWMMIVCSVVMSVGTSVGGYKIIKTVGMSMVKLEKYQGFSADIGAASCLLVASALGIPVSTTHTKTTAIMGVGATKRKTAINYNVVKEMLLAWVLTFPGCGIIGFAVAKLLMAVM